VVCTNLDFDRGGLSHGHSSGQLCSMTTRSGRTPVAFALDTGYTLKRSQIGGQEKTKGMGLPSSQHIFQCFCFISFSLHVSAIRPSSCGTKKKPSLTTILSNLSLKNSSCRSRPMRRLMRNYFWIILFTLY
jgi:hypothetical protein